MGRCSGDRSSLSKSDNAKMLVETVLKTAEIPLVIDADALNIISDNMTLLNEHKCRSL